MKIDLKKEAVFDVDLTGVCDDDVKTFERRVGEFIDAELKKCRPEPEKVRSFPEYTLKHFESIGAIRSPSIHDGYHESQNEKEASTTDASEFFDEIEAIANDVSLLLGRISASFANTPDQEGTNVNTDPMRWLNMARTDIQKGFLVLREAVSHKLGCGEHF